MTSNDYSRQSVGDVRVYSLREHGPDHRLSAHFQLHEFACRDGSDIVLVHPRLIRLLEKIRAEFGLPVHVNSGYRTYAHNEAEGGSPTSAHPKGMAADIWIRGITPKKIAEVADRLGAGGVGTYRTFVHVDVWDKGDRWTG